MEPKIISISIPEYKISSMPNFEFIGKQIDNALTDNFDGNLLLRVLSIYDHPKKTIDELSDIILKLGTDKYNPDRKGVSHLEFEPYKPDIQAGLIEINEGKIIGESLSADIKRFYENTLLDRGYRLRIDIIVLYNPESFVRATKINYNEPSTHPNLEQFLWRFKNPGEKQKALIGIIKILN